MNRNQPRTTATQDVALPNYDRGKGGSREARFWSHVEVGPIPEPKHHPRLFTPCWVWKTAKPGKYVDYFLDGTRRKAHHFAWSLLVGPCPEGLDPDHLCEVKGCVRPDHIEWVTHRENLMRGSSQVAVNACKTHCVHGHPFDEANTVYVERNGHRRRDCRACRHIAAAAARERARSGTALHGNKTKTHCPNGHPYDEENTRVSKEGWRTCRACQRTNARNVSEIRRKAA